MFICIGFGNEAGLCYHKASPQSRYCPRCQKALDKELKMMDVCRRDAIEDAAIIIAHDKGWDMRIFQPKMWHAKRVPTFFGALVLADEEQISVTRRQIVTTPVNEWTVGYHRPRYQTTACVWVSGGCMAGAGRSADPEYQQVIAEGLAFRVAIQKRLYGELK